MWRRPFILKTHYMYIVQLQCKSDTTTNRNQTLTKKGSVTSDINKGTTQFKSLIY